MFSAVVVWCGVNTMLSTTLPSSIIITLISLSSAQDPEPGSPVVASINQCCSLGAERAQTPELGCEDIPVPVKDVIAELQAGRAQICNCNSSYFAIFLMKKMFGKH